MLKEKKKKRRGEKRRRKRRWEKKGDKGDVKTIDIKFEIFMSKTLDIPFYNPIFSIENILVSKNINK